MALWIYFTIFVTNYICTWASVKSAWVPPFSASFADQHTAGETLKILSSVYKINRLYVDVYYAGDIYFNSSTAVKIGNQQIDFLERIITAAKPFPEIQIFAWFEFGMLAYLYVLFITLYIYTLWIGWEQSVSKVCRITKLDSW